MNATHLEKAITLGLGRAVLHLLDHDARSYRDIILDACLHDKSYDPQVEGGRAVYLKDLIQASGDPAFFEDALVDSLKQEADNHWDVTQRFQLARILAQNGNQNARLAMQEAFRGKAISDQAASEFIELDGIAGFLFVAKRIGESLVQNSRQWEDDSLLSVAGEICGREAAEIALKESAETNPNLRAYLAAVTENQALRALNQQHDPGTLTYQGIKTSIEANDAATALRQWAPTASDTDMVLAAHDLLHETDPQS